MRNGLRLASKPASSSSPCAELATIRLARCRRCRIFPAHSRAARRAPPRHPRNRRREGDERMTEKIAVVILDANAETRAEVHRTLRAAGLGVLAEGGLGVEGLTLVRETRPHCVLLGLEQPLERGLQTLEAV